MICEIPTNRGLIDDLGLIARYNCPMLGVPSYILMIADAAFFLALIVSIIFGIVFGHYYLRFEENRVVAIISISIYAIGCILILLFALSTTDIGL
mgnify:FL=1